MLQPVDLGVHAVLFDQFLMAALFHQPAVVEHVVADQPGDEVGAGLG